MPHSLVNVCIENQALALGDRDEGPHFGVEIFSDDPPIEGYLKSWEISLQSRLDHFRYDLENDESEDYGNDPFQLVKCLFVDDRFFGCQSPQISDAPGFEEMRHQACCRDADQEAGEVARELFI